MTKVLELATFIKKQKTGLVKRPVRVKRGGKEFTRQQWVRPEELESQKVSKVKSIVSNTLDDIVNKYIKDHKKEFDSDPSLEYHQFIEDVNSQVFKKVFGKDYKDKLDAAHNVFGEWKQWSSSGGACLFRQIVGKMVGKEKKSEIEINNVVEHDAKEAHPSDTKMQKEYVELLKRRYNADREEYGRHFDEALRVSSEMTQQVLRKQFGDTIRVYRGTTANMARRLEDKFGKLEKGKKYRVDNGILSSWTLKDTVANGRAHINGGIVLVQDIPTSSVLYSDRVNSSSGSGLRSEDEIVFYKENQEVELG